MTRPSDRERRKKWSIVVLAMVVLALMAATQAAPVSITAKPGSPPSEKPRTFIDPFTLKAVTVKPAVADSPTPDPGKRNISWQPVRIPSRPNLRSEFRPSW